MTKKDFVKLINANLGLNLTEKVKLSTLRDLAPGAGLAVPDSFDREPVPVAASIELYAPKKGKDMGKTNTYIKLGAPCLGSQGTFTRIHDGTNPVTAEQKSAMAAELRALADQVESL